MVWQFPGEVDGGGRHIPVFLCLRRLAGKAGIRGLECKEKPAQSVVKVKQRGSKGPLWTLGPSADTLNECQVGG